MFLSTSQNTVKPQLKMLLSAYDTVSLSAEQLYDLGTAPLVNGQFELLNTDAGKIIHQSADHYIAQLELYEAFLQQELRVQISVTAPAIAMCLVFNGNFDLSTDSCSTIPGHAPVAHCYICRLEEGSFYKELPSGNHKTLMLILKTDWLYSRFGSESYLAPLFELVNEHIVHTLPCCRINRPMMLALKKLEVLPGRKMTQGFNHAPVEQLVTQYNQLLANKNYLTSFVHWEKAQTLARFIQENFTSPVVKDISKMASDFCLSEKTLERLGNVAFGVTIHEHVIHLRMTYGMKLLLFTDKPVNEIATLAGYNDPFFFSKTFKKKFGLSPSEIYRPKANKVNNKSNGKSRQKKACLIIFFSNSSI